MIPNGGEGCGHLLARARESERAGDLEAAGEAYRKLLEGRPEHVAARVALGRLLLQADDARGARGELFVALQHDPDQMVARRLLVEANLALGDDLEAHRWLVEYLRIVTDDDDARDLLAEIEPRLRTASPLRTRTLGKLYLEQGHSEEAARVFAGLSEAGHDDAELRALAQRAAAAGQRRHLKTAKLLDRLRAWQRLIERTAESDNGMISAPPV